MKLPNLEKALIPEEKIVKYLLNAEHEEGKSKQSSSFTLGFLWHNGNNLQWHYVIMQEPTK